MIQRLIVRAIQLLQSNPQLFLKRAIAEAKRLQPLPRSRVWKRIDNRVMFEFDFELDPAVGAMYQGVYEMSTVESMKKFLKEGGTFIDVGANIGYLSAIALTLVGHSGQVHSFEPVPQYFEKLRNIIAANKDYRIVAAQCALGEKTGMAEIAVTRLANIGWNTMVPSFMDELSRKETMTVPVYRLDEYLEANKLTGISLIKIDTEGYEFPVLKGLSRYFERAFAPVIICEIAPAAYLLLGYTLVELADYMAKYHYAAFSLDDLRTPVDITRLETTTSVAFIPSEG